MTRVLPALMLGLCCACLALAQEKPSPRPKAAEKIRTTKDTMRKLAIELATAKSMLQAYPEKLDELVKNQIVEKLPKDGWDRDFVYARNKETGYELTSLGADGKAGGEGADADIVFTEQGQKQNLTEDQKAKLAKLRAAQAVIGRKVLALMEMKLLGQLIVAHRRENGDWPQKLEDLKPKGESKQETATARCFTDPWKHPFTFKTLPNDNFAVICLGADGAEGGEEENADFVVTERDIRGEPDEHRGYYNQDWRVDDLAEGVRQYKKINGAMPRELSDLTRGARRIRNDVPRDRFGNEYIFLVISDDEFYVIGTGSDKTAGGIGDAKDNISPRPGQVPYEREGGPQPAEIKPEDSKENKALAIVAEAQMQDIMDAAKRHHDEKKAWPAALDDLKDKLPGKTVPKDPWENGFEFEQVKNAQGEVTGVRVICRGCDKAPGGTAAAADFAVNDKGERDGVTPGDDGIGPVEDGEKPADSPYK